MAQLYEMTVKLDHPVASELAAEIKRRVFFVSSTITDFRLLEADGEVQAVVLRSDQPVDQESLSRKLKSVIASDIADQRFVPGRTIWRSPVDRDGDSRVYQRLLQAGQLAELGEGQVAMGEPWFILADWLDRRLTSLLRAQFPATREYRYPTLIPAQTLDSTGYCTSFPHHVMFVTRLHTDIDIYRRFQEEYQQHGQLDPTMLKLCGNLDYCLPPTMCFHTFGHYRGRQVGIDGLDVVTAKGKAFRFESRYATSLERLWDFTIREMVFLGARAEVLRARRQLMATVFAFIEELGLSGRCEVGNDPFFCDPDTDYERVAAQRFMELKYELQLNAGVGRSIAVGSFNFHDTFFGERFGISLATGKPTVSGCAGFGIERLVHAFACQHGLDPGDWPSSVTAGISG